MSLSTYEVFQQAKDRIAKKTHDRKDEVIVALWEKTAESLLATVEYVKQLDAAKVELRTYCHNLEMAQARLAKFESVAS